MWNKFWLHSGFSTGRKHPNIERPAPRLVPDSFADNRVVLCQQSQLPDAAEVRGGPPQSRYLKPKQRWRRGSTFPAVVAPRTIANLVVSNSEPRVLRPTKALMHVSLEQCLGIAASIVSPRRPI